MSQYSRLSLLKQYCNQFTGTGYYSESIPAKMIENAIRSFSLPMNEQVIAMFDFSLFNNGKEGLLITENGLYWKNSQESACLPWDQFTSLASITEQGKSEINLSQGIIINTLGSSVENNELAIFLNSLQEILDRQRSNDNIADSRDILNHLNLNIIQGICEQYAELRIETEENISVKALKNLRELFPIPSGDRIIVFRDTTLFGKGKNGIAICSSGIYWRNQMGFTKPFLTWCELIEESIELEGNDDIRLGKFGVFQAAGCNRNLLQNMLRDLQIYVRSLQSQETPPIHEYRGKQWGHSLPDSDTERWLLVDNDILLGPYTSSTVHWLIKTKQLDWKFTYVWKEGMTHWLPIIEIPDFIPYINEVYSE